MRERVLFNLKKFKIWIWFDLSAFAFSIIGIAHWASEILEYVAQWGSPGAVRFTNSRTMEEKVSRFYERDFVHSRTTNHESVEIHEFTNKFFNFHEFPNDFSHFHEFPNEKKNNSRLPERRWRGLLNSHFSVS